MASFARGALAGRRRHRRRARHRPHASRAARLQPRRRPRLRVVSRHRASPARAGSSGSWTTAQPDGRAASRRASSATGHAALARLELPRRASGTSTSTSRTWAASSAPTTASSCQNGYRRALQRDHAQVPAACGASTRCRPTSTPSTRPIPDGTRAVPAEQPGRALRPAARDHDLHRGAHQQPGGGARGRRAAQARPALRRRSRATPFPWFAKLFSEIAFGDRVDVANNRVGKGAFVTVPGEPAPAPARRARVPHRQRHHRRAWSRSRARSASSPSARSSCSRSGTSRRATACAPSGRRLDAPRALAVGAARVRRARRRDALGRLRASPRRSAPRFYVGATFGRAATRRRACGATSPRSSPRDRGPSTCSSALQHPLEPSWCRSLPFTL